MLLTITCFQVCRFMFSRWQKKFTVLLNFKASNDRILPSNTQLTNVSLDNTKSLITTVLFIKKRRLRCDYLNTNLSFTDAVEGSLKILLPRFNRICLSFVAVQTNTKFENFSIFQTKVSSLCTIAAINCPDKNMRQNDKISIFSTEKKNILDLSSLRNAFKKRIKTTNCILYLSV